MIKWNTKKKKIINTRDRKGGIEKKQMGQKENKQKKMVVLNPTINNCIKYKWTKYLD